MNTWFNEYAREFVGASLNDLIRLMADIQAQRDRVRDELTELNKQFDVLRLGVIPDKMDEEGVERVSLEGVGTCYTTGDINISARDRDAVIEWLRTIGEDSIVSETVNSSTLKAWAKTRLAQGDEIPEELFRLHVFTRAAIKRG